MECVSHGSYLFAKESNPNPKKATAYSKPIQSVTRTRETVYVGTHGGVPLKLHGVHGACAHPTADYPGTTIYSKLL